MGWAAAWDTIATVISAHSSNIVTIAEKEITLVMENYFGASVFWEQHSVSNFDAFF